MLAAPKAGPNGELLQGVDASGREVMKKREDFAISLRKKKHNEMVNTKRRANIQKCFERIVNKQGGASDSMAQTFQIKDEHTLLQVIHFIDSSTTAGEDRLLMLRQLRQLTLNQEDYKLYEIMKQSGDLIQKLLSFVADQAMNPTLMEQSESLWILANLACEPECSYKLLAEYDAYSVIMSIFQGSYIHQGEQNPPPLTETELEKLEQLMWLLTNLIGDSEMSQADAFERKFDQVLAIVLHNYHYQFRQELWHVFAWCLNSLSTGLKLMKRPQYELFNQFLLLHFEKVENILLNSDTYEQADKVKTAADLMSIINHVISDAEEEQIKLITLN